MKNFVVTTLCKIKTCPEKFEYYQQMYQISLESREKYLRGPFENVLFSKEVENFQEVFRSHFKWIYNLWRENAPCNILYVGPDNLFVKPTEIFGRYKEFRLMNYTDPKSIHQEGYNFDHFLNGDFRYYPAEMSQETWDRGLALVQEWTNHSPWNTEQYIYNTMFWEQPSIREQEPHEVIDPLMHFQMQALSGGVRSVEQFNCAPIREAHLLHFHATRKHLTHYFMRQALDGDLSLKPPPKVSPPRQNRPPPKKVKKPTRTVKRSLRKLLTRKHVRRRP